MPKNVHARTPRCAIDNSAPKWYILLKSYVLLDDLKTLQFTEASFTEELLSPKKSH